MGLFGKSQKAIAVTEEQKWDYITLSDFKSHSCLTPLSYVWLWILVIVSVAVYAADAFTAVNLLAFNKWSSQVKPVVSFDVAKWIFAVCIIVSYVFLLYRWLRALRVMRSGSVTECYLEPLAAIFQSMRVTKNGQGWRRFLVFAELTRSRKGVDYLALFTYFQFKGALLVVIAQGPRMVINALTLWAVMQAQLIPVGEHAAPKDRSPFVQFFMNIETMTKTGNKQETVIYFTMLFSLVIWAIAALSLLLSVIFYVFFLWHYVPSSDGTLTNYCRRKLEARLERITAKKVRKALEKENQKWRKEGGKTTKKGDDSMQRGPTLPKLEGVEDDTASIHSMSTATTLPPYSSQAPSRSNTTSTTTTFRTAAMKPSLPSLGELPVLKRSDTSLSYGTDAPLLSQAGSMGVSSPLAPMQPSESQGDYFQQGSGYRPMPRGPPGRPYAPMPHGRASPQPQRGPLPPVNTSYSNGRVSPPHQLVSPLNEDPRGPRDPPYAHLGSGLANPAFSPYDGRGPVTGPSYEMSPVEVSPLDNGPQNDPYNSYADNDYRRPRMPDALRPASPVQRPTMNGNYMPVSASRSGTAPPSHPRAGLPAALQSAIQRREASQPLPQRGPIMMMQQQQRSATAPLQHPGWGQGPTQRSNTTTPGAGGYNGY